MEGKSCPPLQRVLCRDSLTDRAMTLMRRRLAKQGRNSSTTQQPLNDKNSPIHCHGRYIASRGRGRALAPIQRPTAPLGKGIAGRRSTQISSRLDLPALSDTTLDDGSRLDMELNLLRAMYPSEMRRINATI